jgi:hypothetical protein
VGGVVGGPSDVAGLEEHDYRLILTVTKDRKQC